MVSPPCSSPVMYTQTSLGEEDGSYDCSRLFLPPKSNRRRLSADQPPIQLGTSHLESFPHGQLHAARRQCSDGVDLYTIPHRLLRDPPQSRSRGPKILQREHACRRRVSTAPASSSSTGATPLATIDRTGHSLIPGCGGDTAMAVADDGTVEGVSVRERTESPKSNRDRGRATGPAGRVLLQGEKVSGSVRQGQVSFPTETN